MSDNDQPQYAGYGIPPHVPMNPYMGYSPQMPRRYCRTAAVLQWIAGGLLLMGGLCCLGAVAMMAGGAVSQAEMADIEQQLAASEIPLSPVLVLLTTGVCAGMPGLAYVLLGIFVWRASRVAIVGSMVLSGILGLLLLLNVAGQVLAGDVDAQGLGVAVCLNGMILVGLIILMTLLAKAYGEARRTGAEALASPGELSGWATPESLPPTVSPPPAPPQEPGQPDERKDELPPPPSL